MNRLEGRGAPGGWYYRAMTRAIPTILALLVLTAVVSVGTLYAQGSSEEERPPYRIDLVAGWNLISFPGDPVDTAIESVIGPDLQVDLVLEYQRRADCGRPARGLLPCAMPTVSGRAL